MTVDRHLEQDFIRVTEQAAIAAARTMGLGERKKSDRVAVEAMRLELDQLPMAGRIVIGEGERDEAPMLYIGEEVGALKGRADAVGVDIAVDPLEGTNLCATGAPDATAVLAAAERGGLLHAPDSHMQKIIVGPTAKGRVHIDAPVIENLRVCNVSSGPLDLTGYRITDINGNSWEWPSLVLPAGHTVKVFSGKGQTQADSQAQLEIYLGSATPIWNNKSDRATIYDRFGRAVDARTHEVQTETP